MMRCDDSLSSSLFVANGRYGYSFSLYVLYCTALFVSYYDSITTTTCLLWLVDSLRDRTIHPSIYLPSFPHTLQTEQEERGKQQAVRQQRDRDSQQTHQPINTVKKQVEKLLFPSHNSYNLQEEGEGCVFKRNAIEKGGRKL